MNYKVGDYVIYKESGEVVCNKAGNPTKIVEFLKKYGCDAVWYEDGGWDYADRIEKAGSLLLELL